MKLPPGATGFGPGPESDADLKAFLTVCHGAAHRTNGTVTSTRPAGVTPNFHTTVIENAGQQTTVLRHSALPLVAFTHPLPAGDTTLTFVDHPELAAAISEISDLQILTVDQLHTPISQADLTALTSSEHDQIAYWKPATIAALLFNFWD